MNEAEFKKEYREQMKKNTPDDWEKIQSRLVLHAETGPDTSAPENPAPETDKTGKIKNIFSRKHLPQLISTAAAAAIVVVVLSTGSLYLRHFKDSPVQLRENSAESTVASITTVSAAAPGAVAAAAVPASESPAAAAAAAAPQTLAAASPEAQAADLPAAVSENSAKVRSAVPEGSDTAAGVVPASGTLSSSPSAAAESVKNPEVEKAIIDYYQIPDSDLSSTHYRYSYVDLNDDGTKEILAVISGPYTSGTGGDSALWLSAGESMRVLQSFTLIHTPVIVSDSLTNGYHDLILTRSGGGAKTETVSLKYSGKKYTSVSDAEPVKDKGSITGPEFFVDDVNSADSTFSLAQ